METKVFPPRANHQFCDLDTEATRSHAVKIVERYTIDGAEFKTFEAAIESREEKIEAFVRPMLRAMMPAKAANEIAAVQWILDNRAKLRGLLDY